MLTPEAIERAVQRISLMNFFPAADPGSLAVLAEEIASLCDEDQRADWLSRQFIYAYNQWPGLRELRAFYCAAYKPLDGADLSSEAFSDGVPRRLLGTPPPLANGRPALAPPLEERKQLAAPGSHDAGGFTVDPELEKLVKETAAAAKFPEARKSRTADEIARELYQGRDKITQADIDAVKGSKP